MRRTLAAFTLGLALTAAAPTLVWAQTTGTAGTTAATTNLPAASTGGGGISGSSTNSLIGTQSLLDTVAGTPQITGTPITGATSSSVLSAANPFAPYYANPYYQGRAGAAFNAAPGGFGQVLFPNTGTTGGGQNSGFATAGTSRTSGTGAGLTATSAALGNRSGTFGNTTGTGSASGFGGQGFATAGLGGQQAGRQGQAGGFAAGRQGAAQTAVVIPQPLPIAYTATLAFKAPVAAPSQMQADLRGVLDRSTMLAGAAGIELAMEGNVVVLKGSVGSDDDVRLAENMVRLTPGVREVRNELKVAAPVPVAPVPMP